MRRCVTDCARKCRYSGLSCSAIGSGCFCAASAAADAFARATPPVMSIDAMVAGDHNGESVSAREVEWQTVLHGRDMTEAHA